MSIGCDHGVEGAHAGDRGSGPALNKCMTPFLQSMTFAWGHCQLNHKYMLNGLETQAREVLKMLIKHTVGKELGT